MARRRRLDEWRTGMRMSRCAWAVAVIVCLCLGCARVSDSGPGRPRSEAAKAKRWQVEIDPQTGRVIARARQEVAKAVSYDASYRRMPYPGGDIPPHLGACADLVVRALRARGRDLQVLVQQDRKRAPNAYPSGRLDSSIDHRRCRNLMPFFKRHAKALTLDPAQLEQWRPGDVVFWDLNGKGLLHVGIVSDKLGPSGNPMIIHNIGPAATEDDRLTNWKIIGHFRYPAS